MRAAAHRLLVVIHIVVAAGLVGAALVLIGLGVAGLRGADPVTIYPAAHLVDAWVVAPLAVAALITGIVQTRATGRSLRGTGWIRAKLVITAGMAAVVIFVLAPRLAASAEEALAGQVPDGGYVPLAVAPAAALALVVVNVTLGVRARGVRRFGKAASTEPSVDGKR